MPSGCGTTCSSGELPGFAELKRSLRELPRLRGLGVEQDEVGTQEDWHGGAGAGRSSSVGGAVGSTTPR